MSTSITATTKEKQAETTLGLLLEEFKLGTEAEILERIQAQLAKITGMNLEKGEST